jgi:FKBP-type peptidyl-prolyl cis-trans isomerase FkpA
MNVPCVTVAYVGWLYANTAAENKGTRFDAGQVSFALGGGPPQPIEGWRRGIVGMRVGGQRRVIIPPDLGYGSAGSPPTIPGNATLVFDIELRTVQ